MFDKANVLNPTVREPNRAKKNVMKNSLAFGYEASNPEQQKSG